MSLGGNVRTLHHCYWGLKRTWKVVTGGSTFSRIFTAASIMAKKAAEATISRSPVFLSATSRAPFRKTCSLDNCSITKPVFCARSGSRSPAFGTSRGWLTPVDFIVVAADPFPDDMIQVVGEEEEGGDRRDPCSNFRLRDQVFFSAPLSWVNLADWVAAS